MSNNATSICLVLCPLLGGCVSMLGPADGESDTTTDTDTDTDTGADCTGVGCCVDDGHARPVRHPGPGEVAFSEVMADPGVDDDADGEWIELRVSPTLDGTVDLNDLVVGRVDNPSLWTKLGDTSAPDEQDQMPACLEFSGGQYVILARWGGRRIPGLQHEIDATIDFSLHNDDGYTTLYLRNEETGFEVTTTYSVSPGAAWGLDESRNEWCLSRSPYTSGEIPGEADLGTPGAVNSDCVETCRAKGGDERDVRRPSVGQLVITEVMANPVDGAVEWFEIYNHGGTSFDLNYLVIRLNDGPHGEVAMSAECLDVMPGDYAILATQPVVANISSDYMLDSSATLRNEEGKVEVFAGDADNGDELPLRLVTWASAPTGQSMSLDPASYGCTQDCEQADADHSGWCNSDGTPGAENASCPD